MSGGGEPCPDDVNAQAEGLWSTVLRMFSATEIHKGFPNKLHMGDMDNERYRLKSIKAFRQTQILGRAGLPQMLLSTATDSI